MNLKTKIFVSSPFQLLGIKEFIEKYKIENFSLVAFNYNLNSASQIKQTAEYLNLKITFEYNKINRFIYLKLFSKYFFDKTCNLILGSFHNSHFWFLTKIIRFKNLIFVDDGIASTLINNNNYSKNSFIGKIFGWKYKGKYTHFTIFNMVEKAEINDLLFYKKKIAKKLIDNQIVILGSNLVESNLVSMDDYLNKLNDIKLNYKNSNILYIPHRLENLENYSKYNLPILNSSLCFEVLLLTLERLPKIVLGFYSTGLITTKLLYNEIDVKNIELNNSFKYLNNELKSLLKYYGIKNLNFNENN